MTGWEPDNCHEEIEVQGSADRLCVAAAENGVTVEEVCRKLGISEATFYSERRNIAGWARSSGEWVISFADTTKWELELNF